MRRLILVIALVVAGLLAACVPEYVGPGPGGFVTPGPVVDPDFPVLD